MKGSYINKIFFRIFFFSTFFFFAALNGCAGKPVSATAPLRIQGDKEVLVARDIGRGSSVSRAFWCGSAAIVVYSEEIGIELVKVPTGERLNVSPGGDDYPFNCSPDGEWVMYMDRATTRLDRNGGARPLVYDGKPFEFDPELDVWPVWEGYVADLYRYEVSTGKRERFAVVRSDLPSWEVVSPDGLKAFLGSRHNTPMEMPEPGWKPKWFTREDWDWNQTGAVWFKDSSGVVSRGHTPSNRLFVEHFGNNGWSKRFVLGPEFEDNISMPKVDEKNNIYFLTQERGFGPVNERGGWLLHRCSFEDRDISCETALERSRYVISYDVLPDGDIIFTESDDYCIRRVSSRHSDFECVAGGKRPGEIKIIGISPDGNRLVYETFDDLYVVELIR